MRAVLLALTLAAAPALADDDAAKPAQTEAPKPAVKVALRVVRVMPDSKQALLFDKNRGKHVLVELEGWIEGYQVTEIDEDSVTLTGETSSIVLAAPMRRNANNRKAEPTDPYADIHDPKPADPYAPAPAPASPEDPYKDKDTKEPVRVVEAPKPVEPGSDGVRVVEAPKPDPKPADAKPDPKPADPKPDPKPADPKPAVATPGVLTMTRADFKAELSNFDKLASGVKAAFTDKGTRIDAVTEGSLYARAGLKAGDVVVTVDGRPLKSIDDAADLYAHSGSAKNIEIAVLRAGKSVTLRVTIQ